MSIKLSHKFLALTLPVVLLLSGCSKEERTAAAEQATEALKLDHQDVFSLKVGTCFNDTAELTSESAEGVETLPVRDCSEPHDNEVYFIYNFPKAPNVPSEAEIDAAMEAHCVPAFKSFIGKDYDESEIEMAVLFPSAESWATGDDELVCYVYEPDGKKAQGSLKGAAR